MSLLPLNAAGTAVSFDLDGIINGYANALPLANGALAAVMNGVPVSWAPGGFPIAANGRVVLGNGGIGYWHSGLPFTTLGQLAVFAGGVVNYYNEGVPYTSNGYVAGAQAYSPGSLFTSGEQGVWYDPYDLTTMFQDSAGTTPVTAVEQPVGRIRDKSGNNNHALQATAGSRPVLSALLNMSTKTEVFTDAVWTKQDVTITPNAAQFPGGLQASYVTSTPGLDSYFYGNEAQLAPNVAYVRSVYAKAVAGNGILCMEWQTSADVFVYSMFNLLTGKVVWNSGNATAGMSYVGDGVYRCWSTIPNAQFATAFNIGNYGPSPIVNTVALSGVQLEPGTTPSRYQRVNTATDYDSQGFPYYLRFDGVNDSLTAPAFSVSGDKGIVCVGQQKTSDAVFSIATCYTDTPGTSNGSFSVTAPNAAPPFSNYSISIRGTVTLNNPTAAGSYPAPNAAVLTGIVDFAGSGSGATAQSKFRVNGVQTGALSGAGASMWASPGTYSLGRNGVGASPYTGRIYGNVWRAAAPTAQQITDLEAWMTPRVPIVGPATYSPATLFAAGELGGWWDPGDMTTLWQDDLGTVPVTAVEQPVGRITDRSGRGNHLTQTVAASRAILSARVNILVATEGIALANWSKVNSTSLADQVLAPDGSRTADKLIANTSNVSHYAEPVVQMPGVIDNAVYSVSAFFKKAEYDFARLNMVVKNAGGTTLQYRFSTKEMTIQSGGAGNPGVVFAVDEYPDGWVRLKMGNVSMTAGGTVPRVRAWVVNDAGAATFAGDGASGVYVWGIQVEPGPVVTPYQRVDAAGVYDTVGFPLYLLFDGVDDGYVSPTITFTTDKMLVVTGVMKDTNTSAGQLLELSASSGSNTNVFGMQAPPGDLNGYFWRSRGVGGGDGTIDLTGYPPPSYNVVTGIGDISGDFSAIRVDGVETSTLVDQGTGTYGTFPIYVGRRGGTTFPLKGKWYGAICRASAALTPAQAVLDAERWMGQRMGLVAP